MIAPEVAVGGGGAPAVASASSPIGQTGGFLVLPKKTFAMQHKDGRSDVFLVDPAYDVQCSVGHGAQGVIVAGRRSDGKEVAIKKVSNALDETTSCKRLLERPS